MVGFETVDTIREITLQAERDFVNEFEEENYDMLKCIYEKIEDAAGVCEWAVEIKRDLDFPSFCEDELNLYFKLKGFGIRLTCLDNMMISWYEKLDNLT